MQSETDRKLDDTFTKAKTKVEAEPDDTKSIAQITKDTIQQI